MSGVRSLPSWAPRLMLRTALTRRYWMAAIVELHRRAIEDVVEESGAHPVVWIDGVH